MKTVCAKRSNAQMQIDFRGGRDTHEWKVYPQGNESQRRDPVFRFLIPQNNNRRASKTLQNKK